MSTPLIFMFVQSLKEPFALSLSKGCPSSGGAKEEQGFDRLSPNGCG
jgi:hypothetical protein